MKVFAFQVIGLVLIFFVVTYAIFNNSFLGGPLMPGGGGPNQTSKNNLKQIVIVSSDGKTTKATLSIEVADTADKRGLGLGGRATLDPNSGMLFINFSQPGMLSFWMKGMEFPLDFVWIYSDQVVGVKTDVPPPAAGQTELPLYHPDQVVDKVLEVNAGFVKVHNITPGDKIQQLN